MTQQPPTLVIHDGGLCALVATALAAAEKGPPAPPALLYVHAGRPNDKHAHACFTRQAERYAARSFEVRMPDLWSCPDPPAGQGEGASKDDPLADIQLLAAALRFAVRLDAARLIWPVRVGEDFDAIARVTEMTLLLQQLVGLGRERELAVQTPLLEMTPRQVVEVGHQVDAPWELGRSCLSDRAEPCGVCDGCRWRQEAFEAAALEDTAQPVPLHR